MILFFDTETTGLPNNWNAPVSDTGNWPRMVQLAFQLYDMNRTLIRSGSFLIKPDGYSIPSDISRIHGITTERANREGKDLSLALLEFNSVVNSATLLVAHNMGFDEKIIGCEFYREKIVLVLMTPWSSAIRVSSVASNKRTLPLVLVKNEIGLKLLAKYAPNMWREEILAL